MSTEQAQRQAKTGVAGRLLQYLTLTAEIAATTKRKDEIKGELLDHVERDHTVDEEKGHLLHTLPVPVVVSGKTYTGFMKQRKVTQIFLEDAAEALCRSKGFDIDAYTSRVIDQDKIIRLYAEDAITDDEFQSLTENKVTWAFVPVKE